VKKARFEVPIIPQIGGNVYTFGEEIAGELGQRETNINGVKVKRNEPSIIKNIEEKVVQVVCGAMHTICLTINGNVLTFGCNDDSALGRQTTGVESNLDESNESFDDSDELLAKTPEVVVGLPKIVKVSAGDMHSVALSVDGTVYIWGNFKYDLILF
jgi:regulator of chromosome condensation